VLGKAQCQAQSRDTATDDKNIRDSRGGLGRDRDERRR
jgi:hypothetical protein